jgi:hypothetical protein
MTTELTDEEVIEILARREKWEIGYLSPSGRTIMGKRTDENEYEERMPFTFRYLTSRDALAPILEGLKPDEWSKLFGELNWCGKVSIDDVYWKIMQSILTLPPRDLAHSIARVIKDQIK